MASWQAPPEFRENFLAPFEQEARLSREFDEWVSPKAIDKSHNIFTQYSKLSTSGCLQMLHTWLPQSVVNFNQRPYYQVCASFNKSRDTITRAMT